MWFTSVNRCNSMVSGTNTITGVPLSSSSSSCSSVAAATTSANTTNYLNIISSGVRTENDLTKSSGSYNGQSRHKVSNANLMCEVNLNKHDRQNSLDDSMKWSSYEVALKTSPKKLTHQQAFNDPIFNTDKENIHDEQSIQLNFENELIQYHIPQKESRHGAVAKISNTDRSPNKNNTDVANKPIKRQRSWWKSRFSTRSASSSGFRSKSNIFPTGVKRNRLWNSISRTESPKQEDNSTPKVPRLQIWLSDDPRAEDIGCASQPQEALNNTRGVIPRIHLEYPRHHPKGFDSTRWRALSEGAYNTTQHTTELNTQGETSTVVKSPVEKQPTWPVYQQPSRPKLIHQNCLNSLGKYSEDRGEPNNRRLELPRQNAIAEDDTKDNTKVSSEKPAVRRCEARASIARKLHNKQTVSPKPSVSSQKSGRLHNLGSSLLRAVRNVASSRSYSDEKSDQSETSSETERGQVYNSVFSLTDPNQTEIPSWTSSRTSLMSEIQGRNKSRSFSEDRPDSFSQDFLSPRSPHPPCSRSNSTSSTLLGYDWSQFRLALPGYDDRSRRPSLLSMRSINRSPIPYISMDYDSDYEQYYSAYQGLCPEDIPKLSFTQQLAFPTLHQNSIDRPKPRDPFTESDNNMNTIAKFITFVILTFVAVVIVAGILKLIK